MSWYYFNDRLILEFSSHHLACRHACLHGFTLTSINKVKIRPFEPKQGLHYCNQILSLCQNGHSLQSALLNLQANHFQKKDQFAVIAIQSQLAQGQSIAESLTRFLPSNLASLGHSIRQDGTEENKLSSINVLREALYEQVTLSGQLVKCLTYPYLIIQSSFLLGLISNLLNNSNSLLLMVYWLIVGLMQYLLFCYINKGHLYTMLCSILHSFQVRRTLMLLSALLKSGQTLQNSIHILMHTTSKKSRLQLIEIHLKLLSGKKVCECLPLQWLSANSQAAFKELDKTGDIITPLEQSIDYWQTYNDTRLRWLSKAFPIVGILVASLFVTKTMIALYAPFLESNYFGS